MLHLNSEYPITKKQLQTGFILKNKITDNIKKEFIDKYVLEELNIISIAIINKTIDENIYNELNTHTTIEYNEYDDDNDVEITKIVNKTEGQKKIIFDRVKELQSYKYEFTSNISRPKCENILNKLNAGYTNEIHKLYSISIFNNNPNLLDEIKLKIFNGLKERFPDCLIQIDPLKTYILIDWN